MSFVSKTLSRALILTLVSTQIAWAGRLDRSKIWFGIEYTFQDQEMVNEPGRNTTSTPYKEKKAIAIAKGIAARIGLDDSAITRKESFKQGWYVNVPNDGQWVVNSEPVTIEVNTTPRTIDQIVPTSKPIFEATAAEGLVAHVNVAAERSGMGHIHVGAARMADNPFFAHPLLLRNVMVYIHKNPALLHGFAEAFDIGMDSNIETYHEEKRQEVFRDAIAEFDAWYDGASATQRKQGLNKLIAILERRDSYEIGFFRHYRFVNLQHLSRGGFTRNDKGKITTEFRNFRPPKDPETAKAFAELLLAVMEKQSAPLVKEKFEWIPWQTYLRFNTGTRVLSNWSKLRKELGLKDRILDAEIAEYASAVHRFAYPAPIKGGELFLAHSRKGEKGEYFELRVPASKSTLPPELVIAGQIVDFEKVSFDKTSYWIAIIDSKALGVSADDLKKGRVPMAVRKVIGICGDIFRVAG